MTVKTPDDDRVIEILNALASATQAAFAEADPDTGPVVAWALVAALDDAGREDDVIWVQAPDGQRGFVTTGLLHTALAATDATSHCHEED